MTDEPTFRPLGQLAANIFKRLEDDQRRILMERWLGPDKPKPQDDKQGERKL